MDPLHKNNSRGNDNSHHLTLTDSLLAFKLIITNFSNLSFQDLGKVATS